MKLWTIKTNECAKTFDAHEDKAWALACNKEENLVVTGAGDSTVIVWKVSRREVNVNPLRANFFRGNKNIYLHFVSFLHIDMTQEIEILPQVRQELNYSMQTISGVLTQGARASATMIFAM